MNETFKPSVRALLGEIIDYAGLFPPAHLSMPEAVINYTTYKYSNYDWMLGRFVVPVARLGEFLESARDFFPKDIKKAWRITVLASENIRETVYKIEDFNSEYAPFAVCDSLEVKVDFSSEIENVIGIVPTQLIKTYFEIPLGENLADLVSTLAINKQRAKIRTGGTMPEAFPSAKQIVRFVRTCLAANVPFKATAGLHHPVRCTKPLTYEANAPEGAMHGFLNLFLATGFAKEGFKPRALEELLEDELTESFVFDEKGVHWRENFLNTTLLARLREKNITSFGSCSFTEPIEDLRELGIL